MTPQDLVTARRVLHLTQKQLGAVLAVQPGLIDRWEKGREPPAYPGLAMDGSSQPTGHAPPAKKGPSLEQN